jgi:subtilisin
MTFILGMGKCEQDRETTIMKRVIVHNFYGSRSSFARAQDVIEANGGRVVKSLRYHQAFVAYVPKKDSQIVQNQLPFRTRMIEDKVIKLVSGCEATPEPPQPPPPDQPPGSTQQMPWGIAAVNAPQAWAVTKGRGVLVCVLDTGIDKNHEDLVVLGGENFTNSDASDWGDGHSHGTHVAGTIAAQDNLLGVVGVAPDASLWASRVLDAQGSGYESDVADGILGCISAGAQVINVSLGGATPSSLIRSAVDQALNRGIYFIAAAGNDGGSVIYPAAYPGVIAVSAVDSNLSIAYFSNRGPEVAFAAPGVDVKSTVPGGYSNFDGTSMATPHVAGVAALMLAAGKNILQATDIGLPVNQQGEGLIDSDKTVK